MSTPEPFMLYKLIILYLLDQTTYEITRSQVSEYIISKGYTDFLTLQLVFSELEESNLIECKKMRNRTILSLSEDGHHTISCLSDRLTPAIKDDINTFLRTNGLNIRKELSIQTNYSRLPDKSYEVQLIAKDQKVELIHLNLNVPSEEIAVSICNNWEQKNTAVYQKIIEELF